MMTQRPTTQQQQQQDQNRTAASLGYDHLVSLNNLAVSLLHGNETRQAIDCLRTAFNEMNQVFARHEVTVFEEMDRLEQATTAATNASSSQSTTSSMRPSSALNNMNGSSERETTSDDGHFDLSFSSLTSEDTTFLRQEDDGEDDTDCDHNTSLLSSIPVLDKLLRNPKKRGETCFDFSIFDMYDNALLISRKWETGTLPNEQEIRLVTSVLLYNTGLVHHSRGLASGKTRYLEKAKRMYNVSLQTLEAALVRKSAAAAAAAAAAARGGGVESCCLDELHLQCALLNNIAQIDSQLASFDDMYQTMNLLQNVLHRAEDLMERQNIDMDVENEDDDVLDWFHHNLTLTMWCTSANESIIAFAPAA